MIVFLIPAAASLALPPRQATPNLHTTRSYDVNMKLKVPKLNTDSLPKFWGAHALSWAAAAALLSAAPTKIRAPLLGPDHLRIWPASLVANAAATTSFALGVLLYRNREEAGVALSAVACAYFAGCAGLLHATVEAAPGLLAFGSLGPATILVTRLVKWLRNWHLLLSLGSAAFACKAANKDRQFIVSREGESSSQLNETGLPLLVFVNNAAGANLGKKVASELQEESRKRAVNKFPELFVADLSVTNPRRALEVFHQRHPTFRVVVCGGDGTVAWVLQAIDELKEPSYRPATGIIPLGTGNDMARVFGWGKSASLDSLGSRLSDLNRARAGSVDLWEVVGKLPEGQRSRLMCNYLSLGVDARASLLWARLKRTAPVLFRWRLLAKLWYIILGSPELVRHSFRSLRDECIVSCDGKPIELPPRCEGLMLLNTPSYGGGSDLWDAAGGAPLPSADSMKAEEVQHPSASDGLLELVGVTDVLHLALTLGGFSNGVRICQGRSITIESRKMGIPLQIDGEPYNVGEGGFSIASCEPFKFELQHRGSSLMLRAPTNSAGANVCSNGELAVERALEAGDISLEQRNKLWDSLSRSV